LFSKNPNTTHILEKNLNKINWCALTDNPNAIHILEQNQDEIFYQYFSLNPAIFELDYEAMLLAFEPTAKQIIEYVWHPSRMDKWPEPAFDEEYE